MTSHYTKPELRALAVTGAAYMSATGCSMDEARRLTREWLMDPHPMVAAIQALAQVVVPATLATELG